MREINKLDKTVKERIGKAILKYATNPVKYSEKLTSSKLGSHRFRIGDYRVVFDIEGDVLIILKIGHRKEIYRR